MKKLLSQKEIDNLPAGTKVIITWCGGNDPNEYIIHKRVGNNKSFVKDHNPNSGWWDGEIEFVGKKTFHTKVYEK